MAEAPHRKASMASSKDSIRMKRGLYTIKKTMRVNRIKKAPRQSNYHSLDFDSLRTKIFEDRKKSKTSRTMEWIAYALIGICVGLTCACMMYLEEFLIHEKRHITDLII
mgnify:CR=1 FL=1